MKRLFTGSMVFGVLTALMLVLSTNSVRADVFAGYLKIQNPDGSPFDGNFSDGTDASLTFYLNDAATSVEVEVLDAGSGSVVANLSGGAMSRGLNSVAWDGSGSVSGGQYTFRVTAEQNNASTTEWTMFWDSGPNDIYTRGVAINNNQVDPNFGLIFTSNDGGPLKTGINIYNPDGNPHDPFLVAASIQDGGTIDYGTDAPIFAVMDYEGRLYVSLKDKGQVLRINRDFSADTLIDGLTFPKGLYVAGEGANFTMYVCADQQVLRGVIGEANSFDPNNMEVVGQYAGFYPHQVMLDDDGAMYLTLRASNSLGSDGKGIRKFDISGSLPVGDDDALWFLFEDKTFIANDLLLDSGDDPNSSADDILYYCTRAGGGFDQDGVWRISDINSPFADTVRVLTEDALYGSDENINWRATIDFDAAGNIVLMENSNEHTFFLSPPGVGATNSFTSTSADTVTVGPTGIEDGIQPYTYRLEKNYPNPFNPSTTIKYSLGAAGFTEVTVYNIQGQIVNRLVNEQQTAGDYSVVWNGRNSNGQQVTSGVYILNLRSGDFVKSQRMTFLK